MYLTTGDFSSGAFDFKPPAELFDESRYWLRGLREHSSRYEGGRGEGAFRSPLKLLTVILSQHSQMLGDTAVKGARPTDTTSVHTAWWIATVMCETWRDLPGQDRAQCKVCLDGAW